MTVEREANSEDLARMWPNMTEADRTARYAAMKDAGTLLFVTQAMKTPALTAFLTARFDERDKIAEKATLALVNWQAVTSVVARSGLLAEPGLCAAHIRSHGLERSFDDIEAKRALLGDHQPRSVSDQSCTTCIEDDGEGGWNRVSWPCDVVRAIAYPERRHIDYDPAWAPQ
jgi:hypothetical protein